MNIVDMFKEHLGAIPAPEETSSMDASTAEVPPLPMSNGDEVAAFAHEHIVDGLHLLAIAVLRCLTADSARPLPPTVACQLLRLDLLLPGAILLMQNCSPYEHHAL